MRLSRLMPAALWAVVLSTIAPAQAEPTSGIDRSAIDAHVRPQDDFYLNANGRWLKSAVFPPDKASSAPPSRCRTARRTSCVR